MGKSGRYSIVGELRLVLSDKSRLLFAFPARSAETGALGATLNFVGAQSPLFLARACLMAPGVT